jgi:hypothetical protein
LQAVSVFAVFRQSGNCYPHHQRDESRDQGRSNEHRACNCDAEGHESGAEAPERLMKSSVPGGQTKVNESEDQEDENAQFGVEMDHDDALLRSTLLTPSVISKPKRRFNTAGAIRLLVQQSTVTGLPAEQGDSSWC